MCIDAIKLELWRHSHLQVQTVREKLNKLFISYNLPTALAKGHAFISYSFHLITNHKYALIFFFLNQLVMCGPTTLSLTLKLLVRAKNRLVPSCPGYHLWEAVLVWFLVEKYLMCGSTSSDLSHGFWFWQPVRYLWLTECVVGGCISSLLGWFYLGCSVGKWMKILLRSFLTLY